MYGLGKELVFPHPSLASEEGLLAVGGDLQPERLLLAYKSGIFPWYSQGQPILWWSPDPRMVLFPKELHVSKTMRQLLKRDEFRFSMNTDFSTVIERCSTVPRIGQHGTWITDEMKLAYTKLHKLGHAHSVEVWKDDLLVGGLYGLHLGDAFFGESMFADVSNASKAGFIHLVGHMQNEGVELIDCQVETDHLASLGARTITRERFLGLLEELG